MSNAKPMAAMAQISHWMGVKPGMRDWNRHVCIAGGKVYFTMVPFDFHPRTRVVFGRGSIARAGQLARELGFHRTLLVADAGVVAGRTRRDGPARARSRRRSPSSPSPASARTPTARWSRPARASPRRSASTPSSAIGGGSSLDCAKGINFLLTNGGAMADYRGYGKAATPLLPMIGIPTTAGTGSEAQSYAVISDAATHMKMACGDPSAAFRIAILDPELTADRAAPRHRDGRLRRHRARGRDRRDDAADAAVGHVFAPGLAPALDAFERVLLHPGDCEARSAMMLGAHFAGMAIEQSMLGAAHACANPLTARFDITARPRPRDPPAARRPLERATPARDRYAALLGSPRRRARDDDAAETLAQRLEDFARAGGLPTRLSRHGVRRTPCPNWPSLAAQQWTGTFNPRPFDADGRAGDLRGVRCRSLS